MIRSGRQKAHVVTVPDTEQVVSFEELLMSQVVQQEALTPLLMEEGVFTKEEFLEMVKVSCYALIVKS